MQVINNNSKEAKNTEPGFAAFVENRSASVGTGPSGNGPNQVGTGLSGNGSKWE